MRRWRALGAARPPRLVRSRRGRVAAALVGLALLADVGVLVVAPSLASVHPAGIGAAAGAARSASAARAARGAAERLQDPATAPDPAVVQGVPVRVRIRAIGVDARVLRLGRDRAGVLQPPDSWTAAGWDAAGVVPGDIGPAVLAGHLDTTERAAVFVGLRLLRPGDRVDVVMSTGRRVRFAVDRSTVVPKALFPTSEVYGPTPDAQLRLITCSRPFDPAKGVYADDLVVFATRTA